MAYISYIKNWRYEFDNIAHRKYEVQDTNINQLKLEVHDTFEKDEKITTNVKIVKNEDVINKAYFDEKFLKIDGHI